MSAYRRVPPGVYPANHTPAYRSSEKRAPREPPVVIPRTVSDSPGPRFDIVLRGPAETPWENCT